jgi:translation initiation factor IF-2
MAKKKVFELAEEFKMSSAAMVQMLRGMGISVKGHMSTVDEELRTQIKEKFEQERAEIKKRYDLRRQKAQEETAEAGPVQAAPAPAEPAPAPAQPQSAPAPKAGAQQQHQHQHQKPHGRVDATGQQGQQQKPKSSIRKYHQKESWAKNVYTPQQQPGADAPAASGPKAPQPPAKPDSDTKKAAAAGGKGDKHKKKGGKHRNERPEINEIELKANVKKTLAKLGSGFTKQKYKKDADQRDDEEDTSKKILRVAEFVTANELANMMDVTASAVITKCLEMGAFVTMNQRLDFEMIELVADEFGYTARLME